MLVHSRRFSDFYRAISTYWDNEFLLSVTSRIVREEIKLFGKARIIENVKNGNWGKHRNHIRWKVDNEKQEEKFNVSNRKKKILCWTSWKYRDREWEAQNSVPTFATHQIKKKFKHFCSLLRFTENGINTQIIAVKVSIRHCQLIY